MSWSQGHGHGGASPGSCLLCGGISERDPPPFCSYPGGGQESWPTGSMRTGALPLIWAAQKTQPWMWGLQVSLPQGHEHRRACSASCLPGSGVDKEEISSPPMSLAIYGRWESQPWGHESGKTGHDSHQLQHSRAVPGVVRVAGSAGKLALRA